MTETVQYTNNKEGYGVIRLNRPEKHNAISPLMVEQLQACIQQAKADAIKFLVVTGAGDRMFCSGGDLRNFHGNLTNDEAFTALYPMKEVIYELLSFPVPTICLLNGDALGGGCELATACDFRIAKASTSFGFIQTTLGIVPGWGGGVLLYEKVNPSFAYHWLMDGGIFSATYLEQKGWIHKIIANDEWDQIDKILAPYLSKSYEQMKILKDQYKKKLSVLSLSAQMNEEVRNCANLWESTEHQIAVQRFLNDKK